MKKRILSWLMAAAICLAMLCPLCVHAVTPLDPEAEASLTLHYQKDGEGFENLTIGIFRIAEAFPDGSFRLVAPFSSYPINIHGITSQEQWQQIAQTLWSYIVAEQVPPTVENTTDENGTVTFSGLETGLYFVWEVAAENDTGVYVFNQFMVYLPTPEEDGSYRYAVEANPKCNAFIPKTHYTVVKLWQDGGNLEKRPTEIIVDIYKDGILKESQILNESNQWTYTWYVTGEDHGTWTVAERTVPDSYTVVIQENATVFTIINTRYEPPTVPETGDTFTPLPWMLLMCVSGMSMLVLGIYVRRRKE